MKARVGMFGVLTMAALVLGATVRIAAHHSLAAEFDVESTLTVTGTITEMKWTNPHSWLTVEGKDENGVTGKWAIEFAAPNALYRRGWRRTDLPASATVTVTGYKAKDG